MILHLDPASPVPPYEQLRTQVAAMIASGVLTTATRLPSIRQLAGDLGVAGGTVARAYRELERDGLIVTRGRHGTFVLDQPAKASQADRDEQLAAAAHGFAVRARQLGVDPAAALTHVRQALDRLTPQHP